MWKMNGALGVSAKLPQEMMMLQFIKSRKMKVLN